MSKITNVLLLSWAHDKVLFTRSYKSNNPSLRTDKMSWPLINNYYKQNYPESISPNYILAVKIQSLWQICLSNALK